MMDDCFILRTGMIAFFWYSRLYLKSILLSRVGGTQTELETAGRDREIELPSQKGTRKESNLVPLYPIDIL